MKKLLMLAVVFLGTSAMVNAQTEPAKVAPKKEAKAKKAVKKEVKAAKVEAVKATK